MSKQGLYVKYEVRKKETGELVEDCFVLRPDRDIAAFRALEAYAEETENRELSCQIEHWLENLKKHYPNGAICDYCSTFTDKVRPSPYLANVGSAICKHCWNLARERGNKLEGTDIGDFHDYPHWKGD